MTKIHQSNRLGARRAILRLRDDLIAQLPSVLTAEFAECPEAASLGGLSLVVFAHRQLRQVAPAARNALRDWLEASADPSVRDLLDRKSVV